MAGEGGHFCCAAGVCKAPCFPDSTTCRSALLLVPSCASAPLVLVLSFTDLDAETAFEGSEHPDTAGRDHDVGVIVMSAAALTVSKAGAVGCCTFVRSNFFTRTLESFR